MSDAIEAILLGVRTLKEGEVALTWKIQRDDVPKIASFLELVGHQFGLAFSHLNPQPAQEDRQRHMAARSETPNRYTQRAVILCNELDFQTFLSTDFIQGMNGIWATAKDAVLDLMEVSSRKEIIPGTPAGARWEELMDRFAKWKERSQELR